MGPKLAIVPKGDRGHAGIFPKVGFIPKRPENEQGILTLPPPSVPIDKGPIPEATADADPPEEPPDVQSKFHGFLVIPVRGL
tara:strand:- start:43 stop:288 length:246 start_codon:yes stop_codon:yes gene_type:complete